jgi:phospholipid N-methyltransferase
VSSNRKDATRNAPREDHRLAFLRGFLNRPKEVGSIIPSSRFMEKRIVNTADLANAKLAIELGPGTGGTTKALLREMAPDAKLLAIEINPDFVKLLKKTLRDPRLIVHEGSAADIPAALGKYGLEQAEVILSRIPFSTMDLTLGMSILRSVHAALPIEGRFVAYQFRDRVESLGNDVFGRANVQTELLNMPPMRVYYWEKLVD